MKAIVVDSNYGSVDYNDLIKLQNQYIENNLNLELKHLLSSEEIINMADPYDIILGTGNPPLNRETIESLKNLKLIQRFGIGVNSIDLDAATENGVIVQNMPGFCIEELGVHAATLALSLIRNIGFYDRGIRKSEWLKARGPKPFNPKDMILGLFGFGGSAKELYKIFKNGFGSKILVCDPYIKEGEVKNFDIEIVSFEKLLNLSDIISIHVPLTKETKHIFNYNAFEKMKDKALIVNISRGEIINQEDLITALEEGLIGGAGLDVFENEPLGDSKLTTFDNVVLTPHSAFYGKQSQNTQIELAFSLVNDFVNNKVINKKYVVNIAVLDKISGYKII